MRNIGKRSAVDERQIVFQRLHHIGFDGVFEEGGHGAVGVEVTRPHGLLATGGIAHHNFP